MKKSENKENMPLVVTTEMIEHLPELYRKIGWQYINEGLWILKKPEDAKL